MAALSDEIKQRILSYLPRYPSKQAVTLPALHVVQDHYRHVSVEAITEIADLLDLAPAEVHDTMTFYRFFRPDEKHKLGKIRLWVCQGLACQLRGCDDTLAKLCQKLKVTPGGTSEDGAFTIEAAECIGACEGAPAMLIEDAARNGVTEDKVDGLLDELRK